MAVAGICETLIRFDQLDKESFGRKKLDQSFNCLKIRDIGDVKRIIGPEAYSEYLVDIGGGKTKTYHIFGESHFEKLGFDDFSMMSQHDYPHNTLYMSSFIHSLTTQYPLQKFDLFVETYISNVSSVEQGIENKTSSVSLPLIEHQFRLCLNMKNEEDRAACRSIYPNLRAHNADFREFIEIDHQDKTMYYPHFFSSYYLTEGNKQKFQRKYGINLNDGFINEKFIRDTTLYIKRTLFNHPKIKKQLDAISDQRIVRIIQSVMSVELDKRSYKCIEFIKGEVRPKGYYNFNRRVIMIALYQFVMDMYAIARIFREFPDKVVQKSKELRNYRGNSDSVIYYCGSEHKNIFDLVMNELARNGIINVKPGLYITNPDKGYIDIDISKSFMNGTNFLQGSIQGPVLRPRNIDGRVSAAAADMDDDGGNYLVDFVNHCY